MPGINGTAVLDTFTRANAGTLGSNWTADVTGVGLVSFEVLSNQAAVHALGFTSNWWNAQSFTAKQEAFCTVKTAPSQEARIYVRLANPGTTSVTGYVLIFDPTLISLYRIDNSTTLTLLVNVLQTVVANDVVCVVAIGPVISAYVNSELVCQGFDNTYTNSGYIGVQAQNDSSLAFDDFGGGSVVSSYLQHYDSSAAAGGPTQFIAPVTAGNTLIVVVRNGTLISSGTITVADDINGSYTLLAEQDQTADGHRNSVFVKYNCAAGQPTVTVTAGAGGGSIRFILAEYQPAYAIDKIASTQGNSTTLNSGNTASISAADELIVGAFSNARSFTERVNQTSPLILRSNYGDADAAHPVMLGDYVVSSAGAYSAEVTMSAADMWTAMVLTFSNTLITTFPGIPMQSAGRF